MGSVSVWVWVWIWASGGLEEASFSFSCGGGGGVGANGASRARNISKSGTGGEIRTKMVCDWFSGMVDRRDLGNWVYFAKRRRWPNEGSRANRESSVLHSKTNNMLFMIHFLAGITSTYLITFEAHFTLTSTAYASPNMHCVSGQRVSFPV